MFVIEGIGDEVVQFFFSVIIILLVIAAWSCPRVRDAHKVFFILLVQCLQTWTYEVDIRRRLQRLFTRSGIALVTERHVNNSGHNLVSTELNHGSNETYKPSSVTPGSSTDDHDSDQDSSLKMGLTNEENSIVPANGICTLQNEQDIVQIKLMFSNASVKITEINLNDKIGEFKRHNFNTELSQGKTVMLIFKGKILGGDEEQTLRDLGVFGNCVMHCVIQEPPPATLQPPPSPTGRDGFKNFSLAILVSSGLLLVGLWYSRLQYEELFSLSSTVGLIIMTLLYVAFLAGLCLPGGEASELQVQA